mmetsp:Transcript_31808/g.23003  ORF Transcript_31808/g.23003 Transcript_31808/m.23003 type:complete len:93 (-) Transcript_31808:338-616(-)|eukprot:CAMPEP_0116877158 /NCGR_PEP_ID=MMETSP0463-20121206/8967_1 /TAXON_ID=181622 /ORGANISM="Strombidinopsis sp, Strain SopsisLIS2011" /LENGTH=92 /DNA_ID=CAMNT_0004524217 /DNA_START=134 /DNA_END=412 /DNA_ORIENTATION=-
MEKNIFMAVNLLRYDPKKFVPIVKEVRKTNKLTEKIENVKTLIDALNAMEVNSLSQVKFDEFAVKAVRQRNEEVVKLNEETPAMGGNILAYN